jgi:hypothetical protein
VPTFPQTVSAVEGFLDSARPEILAAKNPAAETKDIRIDN